MVALLPRRASLHLAIAVALLVAAARPASASGLTRAVARALPHPLHTTHAELVYVEASGQLDVVLRVFADDFAAAVMRGNGMRALPAGALPPDSAMFRYVSERFGVVAPPVNGNARPVPLRWCGVRRNAPMLFLCLRAEKAGPLRGARVRNVLMSEVFDDQVNMVQATVGGRHQMLLFTKRDGTKQLS